MASRDYLDCASNDSILKKQVVSAGKLGHFWKSTKKYLTFTNSCDQTTASTKILDKTLERQYPYIFHLAPTFLKSSHWYSSDDFLKKVASCGAFHISRNISSSFVVYGYAQVKQITFLRILFPNKGNNCLIYVKTHFTKHFFSFQVCWLW